MDNDNPKRDRILPDGRKLKEIRTWRDNQKEYKETLVIKADGTKYRMFSNRPLAQVSA